MGCVVAMLVMHLLAALGVQISRKRVPDRKDIERSAVW